MKRIISLTLSVILCFSLFNFSVFAAPGDDTNANIGLNIIPDKTSFAESPSPTTIKYTVQAVVPEGNHLGVIEFNFDVPTGMTLATTNNADTGYYFDSGKYAYHSSFNPNGLFETYAYTPTSKHFIASGTTTDRYLGAGTHDLMTIVATIDANATGSFVLGVTSGVNSAQWDGETTHTVSVNTTPVEIKAAIPTIVTTVPANLSAPISYINGATASALEAVANSADTDATFTYQWTSATNSTTAEADRTVITGATASSYLPTTATNGTTYYYCNVTTSSPNAIEDVTQTVGPFTVTVSDKKVPTIDVKPTINAATYGDKLKDVTFSSDGSATSDGVNVPGIFSWEDGNFPVGDVGNRQHTMIFTPTDLATYETVNLEVNVTVNKLNLSVINIAPISDQSYTGSEITPPLTVTGKVTVGSTDTYTLAFNDYSAVYSNNINASDTARVSINYTAIGNFTFTPTDATFKISPVSGKLEISGTVSKTYDGTDTVDLSVITVNKHGSTGGVNYHYFSAPTGGSPISAPIDVGTYYIGADLVADGNYSTAVAPTRVPYIVSPATYTYSYPTTGTAYQGEPMPTTNATVTAEGIIISGTNEAVTGELKWYTDAAMTIPTSGNFTTVGDMTLYWVFTPSDTNYGDIQKTGSTAFAVSALPEQLFTMDTTAITSEYGSTATGHTATKVADGGDITYSSSNSDIVAVDETTGALTIKAAGDVTITATAAAVPSKYALTTKEYTVSVAQKPISLTIGDATVKYGETLDFTTVTSTLDTGSTLVGSDTIDKLGIVYSTTGTNTSKPGAYPINGTDNDSNYAITFTPGELTINKAAATDKAKTVGIIYSTTSPITVDLADCILSDLGVYNVSVVETTDTNNLGLESSLLVTGNTFTYDLNGLTGSADIGKNVTLTATVQSENYEDYDVVITINITDKQTQILTIANDTIYAKVGEAPFSNKVDGAMTTLTYSSSNEKVATVDNNGLVTIVGAGSAYITAVAEATEVYSEATISYGINVNPQDITTEEFLSSLSWVFDFDFDQVIGIIFNGVTLTLTPDGPDTFIITGYTDFEGEMGTLERSSVKVTFNPEFLNFLPKGQSFNFEIMSSDQVVAGIGTVQTPAEVIVEPTPTPTPTPGEVVPPVTGDNSNTITYIVLSVLSVLALVAVYFRRKAVQSK